VCQALLGDTRLYTLLERIDEDLAGQARAQGCGCGGRLHRARYPRKARGAAGLPPGYGWRHSFCCARADCRRRKTPASVRFLARRVYVAAVVVLVCALRDGPSAVRVAHLREWVGADRRTLGRWRRWWRESFPASALWRVGKGAFVPPVDESRLPGTLLERFALPGARERLIALLGWLQPLSTRAGPDPQELHIDPEGSRS
jgi:hypothetical protein